MQFAELTGFFHTAIEGCIEARKAILDVYNSDDFDVEQKADDSPLTRADRRSHEIIVNLLQTRYPDIPVLSEEGRDIPYEERSQWRRYWLVDPLDGTKEFVKRNGDFTINIALMSDNRPILGVISIPVSGALYFAAKNKGAFLVYEQNGCISQEMLQNAPRLPGTLDPLEGRAVRVVASRSHFSDESRAFVEQLESAHGEVELVNAGSALKFCIVAEGKADAYPRYAPTMEWDTAAGQIIAEESGCTVLEVETAEPLKYNKEELRNPWFVVARRGHGFSSTQFKTGKNGSNEN